MKRATRFFTEDQRARIEQAVAEAESKTSAELIPAVATASGRYDRAEDIIGLWLALILLIIAWPVLHAAESSDWGFSLANFKLPLLIVIVIIGFVIGAVAGGYIGWLRLLFTSRKQMRDEVAGRAHQVFFDQRVHRTAGGTGILVYISLYERIASVIADQTVLEKLGQQTLDDLCHQLTDGLRTTDATSTICAVLKSAGDRLAPVLPRVQNDRQELPNRLVLID